MSNPAEKLQEIAAARVHGRNQITQEIANVESDIQGNRRNTLMCQRKIKLYQQRVAILADIEYSNQIKLAGAKRKLAEHDEVTESADKVART